MLLSVLNREVVYQQELVAIEHIRRFHIPAFATQNDVRWHDAQMSLRLVGHVVIQLHNGVQLSAHALAVIVVIPYKRCGEVVVCRMCR